MADRILVPVDGSDQSRHACELAFEEFPEASVVLLHVINPAEAGYSGAPAFPSASEEWYEKRRERAEDLFEELAATAAEHGVEIAEHRVEVGKPTRTIVDAIEETGADHVVMGSHGREGVTRVLLGSVAETVIRRSPVPVTVTR